ncbi:helix-turn-helix transcriptional regulator [Sphingopyxis sp. 550A]
MFDSEFVHICHLPTAQPEMVKSLAQDGSRRAEEQSASYLARKMWQFDPTINAGSRWEDSAPLFSQLDIAAPETKELKHFYEAANIRERVVVYGKGADGHLGLSIVRTAARGAFTGEERSRIGLIGEIAFPLLARHYALVNERNIISSALSSLPLIENCIALSGHTIPRREAQVAARMLYGMTCEGAALDLSIAYETALSYKKRFYQRFNLGGFRDLLSWYLMQFSGTCHLLCGTLKH